MKVGTQVTLSEAGCAAHITDMARWRGVVEGVDAYGRVLVNWENGKTYSEWPEWLDRMVG